MIELPEGTTVARQIVAELGERKITGVFNATHPHKFTWYSGNPANYPVLLTGRTIVGAAGHGAFVDMQLDEGWHLAVSDGVNMRYYDSDGDVPAKYQLLLTLDNNGFLVFTVAMYGGINVFKDCLENSYYLGAVSKPSPLEDRFDAAYFEALLSGTKPTASTKAFLATEQRIPGLGNGVLQDVLFRAKIHPKRKISSLKSEELEVLFRTVKELLRQMTDEGGRNTEKDLHGATGGYQVILSRITCANPCPVCGGEIHKEAYLGGAVYYCLGCQPI